MPEDNIHEDPRQHILPVYRPPEEVFVEGQGAYLFTEDGRRYLDFIAGIAVTALGHAHPAMVEALRDQAGKLWHTSNMFRVKGQEELADKICRDTFADRVFFTNSGTEAVECALKSARKYHWSRGNPDRIDIITFTGAFHGRSIGAINAGGNPKYLEGFGPKLPGFVHLEWGDHDALKTAAAEPTAAAIFVEVVQGEGGVRAMPEACIKGLRELCDAHGLLLIFDEVQCGMGRTGKLWGYQWADGVEPDILCAAKGIGGGFPFGACLMTEAVGAPMQPGSHGSTYGGNPLACAIGARVTEIIADPAFLAEVGRKSALFRQRLEGLVAAHPDLFEAVRGQGLMLGLKCCEAVAPADLVAAGYAEHLLTVPAADNTLRILPPLTISDDEIAEATARLDRAATTLSTRHA